MKNRLSDLNNHLFAQLERLSDEDLKDDELKEEVSRAQAVVSVSDQIIDNARLSLSAAKLFAEHGNQILPMLPSIGKDGAEGPTE